jgi:hypothetical protein
LQSEIARRAATVIKRFVSLKFPVLEEEGISLGTWDFFTRYSQRETKIFVFPKRCKGKSVGVV